ncbi:MAG: phosphonate C-P lyase system protein PhnG [Roseovarius sp.]|nr:phosphonate C-P lyase system protein PhnG [Roseovarius sp.]
MADETGAESDRQAWMGLLARSPEGRVADLFESAGAGPDYEWLRRPEIGSIMVRGRAGGAGAPFNIGEMTVTRCSLRLGTGEVGHAYVQGRRPADAQAAALVDALLQTSDAGPVRAAVLDPLLAEEGARKTARAAKAAATKVDFFTMTRGED